MNQAIRRGVTILALCSGTTTTANSQSGIVVRDLIQIGSPSIARFGKILGTRPLEGGGVLVNDGERRRLLALDQAMTESRVVIDSVSTGGQGYGPVATPLIPFLADSSLFVDGSSSSLLLVSPKGVVARVMAPPRAEDLRQLSFGRTGADASGNLIYVGAQGTTTKIISTEHTITQPSDSAPLIRASFETRQVDTIAMVKAASGTRNSIRTVEGRTVNTMIINPLWAIDDWAVLSDGSVAIIRGHDYSAEILRNDGNNIKSPKLAFDWKRLEDIDKQRLIDSARTAREAAARARDEARRASSAGRASPAGRTDDTYKLVVDYVALKEIQDYWPPIRPGAVQADLDKNLWVLTTTSAQSLHGELIYDVINNSGILKERVRLPVGKSIVGFGHDNVVYLTYKDGDSGWALVKAKRK